MSQRKKADSLLPLEIETKVNKEELPTIRELDLSIKFIFINSVGKWEFQVEIFLTTNFLCLIIFIIFFSRLDFLANSLHILSFLQFLSFLLWYFHFFFFPIISVFFFLYVFKYSFSFLFQLLKHLQKINKQIFKFYSHWIWENWI